MATTDSDFYERLAAAYNADRDRFHRVAALALVANGFRGADVAYQDVVQNAIVSLFEQPVSGVDNYAALLTTTIKRRAIDLIRSESRRAVRTAEAGHRQLVSTSNPYEDVDDTVDASRMIERLNDALGALLPDERRVLLAVDVRGETQVSVALAMGISKQRVGQLLAQARARVMTMLKESEL